MSSPIRSWATNGILKKLANSHKRDHVCEPASQCWTEPVPYNREFTIQILQQPDKITIIHDQHHDVLTNCDSSSTEKPCAISSR
jgi:hypothetical protein